MAEHWRAVRPFAFGALDRFPPDLVIVGVGERMTARLDPVLVKHLASKGIRVEQMDTVSA